MGSRCGTWRHRSNDGACSMRRDEFNTDTRTVTTYDESGAVVSTRPYTADENATADAAVASAASLVDIEARLARIEAKLWPPVDPDAEVPATVAVDAPVRGGFWWRRA